LNTGLLTSFHREDAKPWWELASSYSKEPNQAAQPVYLPFSLCLGDFVVSKKKVKQSDCGWFISYVFSMPCS